MERENIPDYENYEQIKISSSLDETLTDIRTIMGNTMDLNILEIEISGVKCAVIAIEGMIATLNISQIVYKYLMGFHADNADFKTVFDFVTKQSLLTNYRKNIYTYGDVVRFAFSGFGIIFFDGLAKAVALGIQGYDKRSVTEPTSEVNIKGSHEGFIEAIRSNISLVRRRMKTPALRFELLQVGTSSKTDVCIAYIKGKAPDKYVDKVRQQLKDIKLETVLTSGYIAPFLESGKKRLFSDFSSTERPDLFCAKLTQGRVGVLIDGTPFAIVVPALFSENFISIDDYASKPYYTAYIKALKYFCFFITIAMPGIYVALATFHPGTFSHKLLLNLAVSEEGTPFPLYVEVLIMMIFYEIMREAGIRLPRAVGGAVSIVGGLIIGDAAVSSGLISVSILIVIGLTATASFVIPSLNEQTSVLRLIFIIAGGLWGLFGIGIAIALVLSNICASENLNVPYTSPFSPLKKDKLVNALARRSFFTLEKTSSKISDLSSSREE